MRSCSLAACWTQGSSGVVHGHRHTIRQETEVQLPMHGGRKELGRGLVAKVQRCLELD